MELESKPCPLGCKGKDGYILTGCDRLHDLPGDFSIVQCDQCGLMRTNPRPTADEIGFYYPDDYGPFLGTEVGLSPQENGALKKWLKPLVNKIFSTKAHALPPLPVGKLLEIGCASGAFLKVMAEKGWQVEGVEVSETAGEKARQLGYPVQIGALESLVIPDDAFDLIVGWMVLEHLHDPVAAMKKLHKSAKSEAWLTLSVPNVETKEFAIFKDKWHSLHLPNHLYHFSPASLSQMLQAAGWEVSKVHHQRSIIDLVMSLSSVADERGWIRLGGALRKLTSGGVWFYLTYPIAWFLALFGQTGRMTVWARKV